MFQSLIKGKYLAIAEWPVGKLFAVYALFYEYEFIGIVEAKKMIRILFLIFHYYS